MSQLQLFVAEIGKNCKRISKKAVTPTYNIIKPSKSGYHIEKGSCAYFPFRNFEEYVIMGPGLSRNWPEYSLLSPEEGNEPKRAGRASSRIGSAYQSY